MRRSFLCSQFAILLLCVGGCPPNENGNDNGNGNDSNGNTSQNGNENQNANANGNDNASNNGSSGGVPPTLKINAVTPDAVKDQLILSGEFGDPTGIVTLGGQTLNVVSWGPASPQPQQIFCELPRELAGNIVVQNGNNFSNTAQLTRWDLHLVSRTVINDPSASGELHIDITVDLILRACINDLLNSTGDFTVLSSVSRASTALVEGSGTQNVVPPPGHSLDQFVNGTIPNQNFLIVYPGDVIDPAVDIFTIGSIVNYANRSASGGGGMKLLFTLTGAYNQTEILDNTSSTAQRLTGFATNTFFDTAQPNQFLFDNGFNIVAGTATAFSDPGTTLEWSQATAQSPPVDTP